MKTGIKTLQIYILHSKIILMWIRFWIQMFKRTVEILLITNFFTLLQT